MRKMQEEIDKFQATGKDIPSHVLAEFKEESLV